jgi:predicted nucleotidyltransferase
MLQASKLYRIGKKPVRVPCVAHFVALKLHAIKNMPERERKDMQDITELLEENSDAVSSDELRALCRQYGPDGIDAKLGDFL